MAGRKRHILVDTQGFLVAVKVHPANVQDRDGAKLLLRTVRKRDLKRVEVVFADAAYQGRLVRWIWERFHWATCLVRRLKPRWLLGELVEPVLGAGMPPKGFVILPKRWIVERTLAWLGRFRRLSKDYESLCETEEAFIRAAMVRLLLARLG